MNAARDPETPLCLLLLPRTLEEFILRDQATDLLRAPGVIAVEAPRVPYGVLGRLPAALADAFAAAQAARLGRRRVLPGAPRVVVLFHPFQYPLARAVLQRWPDCELWYARWDRYEDAFDASDSDRARLRDLHERAAQRATLTWVVSGDLERQEREAGRDAVLIPLAADSFPAPDPSGGTVAVSLGHQGWRNDWALLREVAERMPELTVLLVGAWRDDQGAGDSDYAACRAAPSLLWLGRRTDEEAARLIALADVGLVPFRDAPFNQAALPFRILKYALLGRRTISTDLAGVRTWERAVTIASGAEEWVTALRAAAGARARPDLELREWAASQTSERQNAPLWERLEELGIASRTQAAMTAPHAPGASGVTGQVT